MGMIVYEAEQLNLPENIAAKLKGKKIELLETAEGILIKPIEDPIAELRGFLKGSQFNTETYMKQKKQDKELEQ